MLKVPILVKLFFYFLFIRYNLEGELELNDNGINHTPENWLNTSSNEDINLNKFDESQVSLHVTLPSHKKIKLSSDVQSYHSTDKTPIMKPVMHSESDKKGKCD